MKAKTVAVVVTGAVAVSGLAYLEASFASSQVNVNQSISGSPLVSPYYEGSDVVFEALDHFSVVVPLLAGHGNFNKTAST